MKYREPVQLERTFSVTLNVKSKHISKVLAHKSLLNTFTRMIITIAANISRS